MGAGTVGGAFGESELVGFLVVGGAVLLLILLFFILPFFILSIFMSIGFLKGWRWAVIVAIACSGLCILSDLFGFTTGDITDMASSFTGLIIGGFFLYLEIICLQHPFYNQKKQA